MSPLIDFEPVGRRGECPKDETLQGCARLLGVGITSLCGGIGKCGQCIVQIVDGHVSAPTPEDAEYLTPDAIAQGYRLACRTIPLADCRVRVPLESLTSPQRMQVEGEETPVAPDPLAKSYLVTLQPPSLDDLRADAGRLANALQEQHHVTATRVDLDVLREISSSLRAHIDRESGSWRVRVVTREGEVIGLLPPEASPLGLAIDLGTTKIAAYLVHLASGRTLASHGLMNPQIAYGEDVVARIALAEQDEGKRSLLRQLVVGAVNEVATELCSRVEAEASQIVDMVVVGNTAMHHLFLGLPVRQLGLAPYVPAVTSALDVKARDLGLQLAPGAYVHLLPNVAGYVGADHAAMLLATQIADLRGVVLAIDIGTNTEICLANEGVLTSTSCASGPAFEGAHIKHGMRAANGAIERLRLVGDKIEYQTIGGVPPVGLCGSGIVDVMAQLFLAGVLDRQGRMQDHPRVREVDGVREFVLVDELPLLSGSASEARRSAIVFTQQDVRQLQLAKGAMRTGIEMLLSTSGRKVEEIDSVIIAGAFGSYIDVSSAITIGLFPRLSLERFHQVGNAAGMGAKLALVSRAKRDAAQVLASRIGYLELAAHPLFSATFAQAMLLG
ncbi:MAG: ASKHA domain-containing protein [Chloroflexi bacterium]|jgi:uncharacterized 2Fe-2S/4Fe-4S cluster protein (DUF4445 family)|nr:ASKHA domain-containing protein [Chloroflexota bacterium]